VERDQRLLDQLRRTQENRQAESPEEAQVRRETNRNRENERYRLEQAELAQEVDEELTRLSQQEQLDEEATTEALEQTVLVGGVHLWAFHDREQTLDENTIRFFDCGINDQICAYCQARNFRGERHRRGYSICCARGKVHLNPLQDVEEFLRELFCPTNQANEPSIEMSKVLLLLLKNSFITCGLCSVF
jgi:hypothetical protein